jgi:hypothetical protein
MLARGCICLAVPMYSTRPLYGNCKRFAGVISERWAGFAISATHAHAPATQVLGTPLCLTEEQRYASFEAGWSNSYNGKEENGYYIGQQHQPGHTQVSCSH